MDVDDAGAVHDLTVALRDNQVVESAKENVTLRHHYAGDLTLTSGSVVACDPKWIVDQLQPFVTRVEPGRYPIILSIARFSDGNERVAYATIRIRETEPLRWEIAKRIGDDMAPGSASYYSVDSGKGCFLDADVLRHLLEECDDQPHYEKLLDEAISSTRVRTWGWANVRIGTANIVAFSSGLGDGAYVTYLGYDDSDTLICFTTDFALLDEGEKDEDEEFLPEDL